MDVRHNRQRFEFVVAQTTKQPAFAAQTVEVEPAVVVKVTPHAVAAAGKRFDGAELSVAGIAEQLAACDQVGATITVVVRPGDERTATQARRCRDVFENGLRSGNLSTGREQQDHGYCQEKDVIASEFHHCWLPFN